MQTLTLLALWRCVNVWTSQLMLSICFDVPAAVLSIIGRRSSARHLANDTWCIATFGTQQDWGWQVSKHVGFSCLSSHKGNRWFWFVGFFYFSAITTGCSREFMCRFVVPGRFHGRPFAEAQSWKMCNFIAEQWPQKTNRLDKPATTSRSFSWQTVTLETNRMHRRQLSSWRAHGIFGKRGSLNIVWQFLIDYWLNPFALFETFFGNL